MDDMRKAMLPVMGRWTWTDINAYVYGDDQGALAMVVGSPFGWAIIMKGSAQGCFQTRDAACIEAEKIAVR